MLLKIKNLDLILDDSVYESLKDKRFTVEIITRNGIITPRAYINIPQRVSLPRYLMQLPCNDPRVVDHINRNTLDNRLENLRICTHAENLRNRSKSYLSLSSKFNSPYKGVAYNRDGRTWFSNLRFRVKDERKRTHLLSSQSQEECAYAYDFGCKLINATTAYLNNVNICEPRKTEIENIVKKKLESLGVVCVQC